MVDWTVIIGSAVLGLITLYNWHLSYKQALVYDKMVELVNINTQILNIIKEKCNNDGCK